jgi:serine/threonine protein kinase
MPSPGSSVDSTAVIERPTSTQQSPHPDTFIFAHKCAHPESSRPRYHRRPSHDLFECIEQSPHHRLSEDQARYIFAQIVDAVHYLDQQGVTHRDIKDENLVIDKDLHVSVNSVLHFHHR